MENRQLEARATNTRAKK